MTSDRPAGRVFLVGAGPGDPGLLTVRGLELLRAADVVVYDRLGVVRLLKECRPDAELISVGKARGHHTLPQDEINRLLVEKARAGKAVVRLKGGDPFVFSRGGEEAEALAEAGVAFEVVPGVTSAVAVPAYAGIPVTRRGMASSFAVVTGHEDPARPDNRIDWRGLATGPDTLVILMGLAHLPAIAARLIAGGRPADTPAAVIGCGTTGGQQVVVGTLADVAALATAAGVQSPALTVVGEVVRLRERLAWFERRPLAGRRILVSRPPGQATALSRRIADLGGEVVEVPLIRILPPADWTAVDRALDELGTYDWVVFTSANGVEFFCRRLWERGGDARALAGVGVAAVGEATAATLAERGLRPDLVPGEFRGGAMVDPLAGRCRPGARLLLVRGDLAAPDLPAGLAARGLSPREVVVYHTRSDTVGGEEVRRLLTRGDLDALTFASPSAVDGFLAAVGPDAPALLGRAAVACIGPTTAAAARARGLPVDVVAARSNSEGLAAALADHFRSAESATGVEI